MEISISTNLSSWGVDESLWEINKLRIWLRLFHRSRVIVEKFWKHSAATLPHAVGFIFDTSHIPVCRYVQTLFSHRFLVNDSHLLSIFKTVVTPAIKRFPCSHQPIHPLVLTASTDPNHMIDLLTARDVAGLLPVIDADSVDCMTFYHHSSR